MQLASWSRSGSDRVARLLLCGPLTCTDVMLLHCCCRAVARHGEKNWSTVARTFNQLMGRPPLLGRAPKQCRSRYLQQLVPGIKTGEWSVEEEEILVEGHKQFGNQWTLIASMLPGRTETSVKNHYNCTARRCVKGTAESGVRAIPSAAWLHGGAGTARCHRCHAVVSG